MNKHWKCVGILVLVLAASPSVFAQQPAPSGGTSHKYRTIMTLTGAGGGFVAGTFVGLAAFDDAINSDRKVWTSAIVGAAGGAVGGFFLGRFLDKRKNRAGLPADRFNVQALVSKETKGVRLSFAFR